MCLALYARVTRCPSFRGRHIEPLIFNGSIGRSARYKRVVLTLVSTFDSHASSVSELLVGPTGLCLEPTALQQHTVLGQIGPLIYWVTVVGTVPTSVLYRRRYRTDVGTAKAHMAPDWEP